MKLACRAYYTRYQVLFHLKQISEVIMQYSKVIMTAGKLGHDWVCLDKPNQIN